VPPNNVQDNPDDAVDNVSFNVISLFITRLFPALPDSAGYEVFNIDPKARHTSNVSLRSISVVLFFAFTLLAKLI
jgi:hypothetical protein